MSKLHKFIIMLLCCPCVLYIYMYIYRVILACMEKLERPVETEAR